jgi:hypothetical protein
MSKNHKLKQTIYSAIDNLYQERDRTTELKNDLDYDTEFGVLVTTTTRLKIINELLVIMKILKHDSKDKQILNKIDKLKPRLKLHFKQLEKMNQKNTEQNREYFTLILKIIYSFVLF